MKVIKLDDAETGKNSEVCKTLEYSFGDREIDLGVATITGRFPENGFAYNEVSRELIYVIEGTGKLVFKDSIVEFKKADAILIMPGDRYFWETEYAVVTMNCAPSWSPDQHKIEL